MCRLVLTLDSSFDEVPAAGAAIRQACEQSGVGAGEASLVELALVEAIQNTIEHGYGGRAGHRVDIELRVDDRYIDAAVSDTGHPVDPARVAPRAEVDLQPTDDRSALLERGRGVIILRGVFDDVSYSHDANGNRLALRRRRREAV